MWCAGWLAYWGSNQDRFSPAAFLCISGGLAGLNVFFAGLRSVLFAWAGLRAAERCYDGLAAHIMRSPLTFFENTSPGSLSNRMGKVGQDSPIYTYTYIHSYIDTYIRRTV